MVFAMMALIRALNILTVFLILATGPTNSFGAELKRRPKIGLVLGGGGARGAAHVGVLKVLEQQRIPIDYIAGTSMGAIVGAAYAVGLSPNQIEKTLNSIDWGDLFVDDAPRAELPFRDKMDQRRFTGVEIGVGPEGILLPSGAFAGRKLEFLLQAIFLPAAERESFDDLDIPFRAIATNIETGEAVAFDHGKLAQAVRASMSIPGAFSPVEIDGNLYVDGYVSKNLPIDVAKAMGADIIIAVDVGTPLAKRDKIQSLLDIVNQVGGIATIKNVEEQISLLKARDLILRPDLGNHATTDFQSIAKIIPLGEQSAHASIPKLKELSVSPDQYQRFLETQRKRPAEPLVADFIRVAPTERVSPERIEAKLSIKAGESLDLEQASEDLSRIQSIGEFEQVGFRLTEENKKTGLIIEAKEKSWGPNYLRFGFNLNSDFESDNYFGVLLDHRLTSINALGGEWESQLAVGRQSRISTEFYQPLDYSNLFFVDTVAELRQDLRDIYSDGNRLAEYRTRRYGIAFDTGINFGNVAELRAGVWTGHMESEPSTGAADLPEFNIGRGALRVQLTYDQIDNANFPRNGGYFKISEWLERPWVGSDDSYNKAELQGNFAASLDTHTLLLKGQLGLNSSDDLPFYDEFVLGGASSLSGYRTDELHGRQMGLIKLMYYNQLSNNLFSFSRASYLGGSLDWGNVWQDYDDIAFDDLVFGGSLFYGTDTMFGPLYLGYGLNEVARPGTFFMSLGQRF